MHIKDIELRKGMSKEEVNELISEWLLLEDDILGKTIDKHNWKCKCGNIIKGKSWHTIKRSSNARCNLCERKYLSNQHKSKIESDGNYIYKKSYFKGDKLPNGKIVEKDKTYVEYIHKYCGSVRVSRTDYISCTECCGIYENSLAHHVEVELKESLEKYWDFEKNKVNPYHICKGSTDLKIWIKCQNEDINSINGLKKKDYHGSYEVSCSNFVKGARCGYCNPKKADGSHPYDSFGYYNFDKIMNWHPDNNISPFRIAPNTTKKYKFTCLECGHVNIRKIVNVNIKDNVCVLCGKSKGEKRIKTWLDYNNMDYVCDEPYFDDLIGIGGGVLRPDFILPKEKIWIEYDGEFHYKDIYKDGYHEKQLINDKRKNKYAKINGWNLIRIPYIEFDNIENILEKELLNHV